MRIALVILIACLFGVSTPSAQNIFDDEALEKPEVKEPVEKPVKAKKKKKARKKKRQLPSAEAVSPSRAEYTPEELAKSSYAWAPELETPALISTAPGIKPVQVKEIGKPQVPEIKPDQLESRPAPSQGFRLPQIPLAQVLIVAGFVILFLIYRVRVGSQIKRKKY